MRQENTLLLKRDYVRRRGWDNCTLANRRTIQWGAARMQDCHDSPGMVLFAPRNKSAREQSAPLALRGVHRRIKHEEPDIRHRLVHERGCAIHNTAGQSGTIHSTVLVSTYAEI